MVLARGIRTEGIHGSQMLDGIWISHRNKHDRSVSFGQSVTIRITNFLTRVEMSRKDVRKILL
jgi:hypothetical protein